jgi:RNA polymerase sigma-70 factor, ECF subfamily
MLEIAMGSDKPVIPAPSGADLLQRWVHHRDRSALESAIRPHLDAGWRLAKRLTNSEADAEDVLQDACIQVVRKAHQYRGQGSLCSWFLGIVANAGRMRLRREATRKTIAPSPTTDITPDPDGLGERALIELDRLPVHERLPIWLHAVEGLSYEEVATSLRRSEATIRSQVSRGLERLRDSLNRRGGSISLGALAAALSVGRAEAAPSVVLTASAKILATTTASIVFPVLLTILALVAMVGGSAVWLERQGLIGHAREQRPSPAAAAETQPAAAPRTSLITFVRDGQIWLMDERGDKQRRACPKPHPALPWDASPRWSPDARKIAFAGKDGFISIIDVKAGTCSRLCESRGVDPVWSPDGGRIVFGHKESEDAQNRNVDLMSVDVGSGNVVQLTSTRDITENHPAWSPDGLNVACEARKNGTGPCEVRVLELAASKVPVRRIENANAPTWLPDGRILFRQEDMLCIEDAVGTSRTELPVPGYVPIDPFRPSPDGSSLLFIAVAERQGPHDDLIKRFLLTYDLAARRGTVLVDPSNQPFHSITQHEWSPDSRYVVFATQGSEARRGIVFQVHRIERSGSGLTMLADDPAESPAWSPIH